MGKLMILNGSPRAPQSNSKQYASIFRSYYKEDIVEYHITPRNHEEILSRLEGCTDLLLVFPLYADSIPVTLHNFLKSLEQHPPASKPTVSVLINCGFLEPEQNQIAVDILKLFCKQHGYPYSCTLCIGGGEAFLKTPFAFLAKSKIKALAKAIQANQPEEFAVTMPISKKSFLKASTKYWLRYGQKYGVSREQMDTMQIEE